MRRIIILGPGGSGKDYLRKHFEKKNVVYQISYTTRPPREGEINGQDYYFLSEEKFDEMTKDKLWYEFQTYLPNPYRYGTTQKQFYGKNFSVFIMSPQGIACLSKKDRLESYIVYLNPKDSKDMKKEEVIEKRLRQRGLTKEKIEERKKADQIHFARYMHSLPGMEINDIFFDANEIVEKIMHSLF